MTRRETLTRIRPTELKAGDHFMLGCGPRAYDVWEVTGSPEFTNRDVVVPVTVAGSPGLDARTTLALDGPDVVLTTHRPIAPDPRVTATPTIAGLLAQAGRDARVIADQADRIATLEAAVESLRPRIAKS